VTLPSDNVRHFAITSELDLRVAVTSVFRLPMLGDADPADRSTIATIVSELGSNILKYARRGCVELVRTDSSDAAVVEVRAFDRGPGIADVDLAMSDHASTGGTLGLGLPGVRRLADRFEITSRRGEGTSVVAAKQIVGRPVPSNAARATDTRIIVPGAARRADGGCAEAVFDTVSRVRPAPGQSVCGDRALAIEIDGGVLCAVVDGAGHGLAAHQVATVLTSTLRMDATANLQRLMERLHDAARGSVGAVAGLAFIDPAARTVRYVGVGNPRIHRSGHGNWSGFAGDGLLGERLGHPVEQSASFEPGDVLLMSTDGLRELPARDYLDRSRGTGIAAIGDALMAGGAKPHDDVGCLLVAWSA
jgi:anti-sigma regulatory factor (Ser/Thr protein kinase)